jgi:hypothetical protein
LLPVTMTVLPENEVVGEGRLSKSCLNRAMMGLVE